MAASATMSTATVAATMTFSSSKVQNRKRKLVFISGMNSYSGLKAQNTVTSLGRPVTTRQWFTNIDNKLNRSYKKSGGGALAVKCSAAVEIFKIAAIMNGLTLVGVAVGFVLLKIEASVEESE